MWHRHFLCEGAAFERHSNMPEEIRAALGEGKLDDHPVLTAHLWTPEFAAPSGKRPAENFRWLSRNQEDRGHFDGDCFSDGSVFGAEFAGLEVAGVAVIQLGREHSGQFFVDRVVSGPLPDNLQCDINGAELFALMLFLRAALPQATLATDSLYVIGGLAKGFEATTSFRHSWAHIWKVVWRLLADLGPDFALNNIRKVQGHASQLQVLAGTVAVKDKVGNDYADHWAKEGAKSIRGNAEALQTKRVRIRKCVLSLGRWIGRVGNKIGRLDVDTLPPAKRLRKEMVEATVLANRFRHQVVCKADSASMLRCDLCCASASPGAGVWARPCKGSPVARARLASKALAEQDLEAHMAVEVFGTNGKRYALCSLCGCFGGRHLRAFFRACPVVAAKGGLRNLKNYHRQKGLVGGVALRHGDEGG